MQIRTFNLTEDFDVIKTWITDERTHMMWCANLITYPLEKEKLRSFLSEIAGKFGDSPFVAVDDEGRVVGFYCYSLNHETHEGMLFSLMCFLRIQEPRDAMRVLDLPKGKILLTHSSIKTSLGADVI